MASNYYALCEAIAAEKECIPDLILNKYGLIELSSNDIKIIEALEMKRLHLEEKLSYREIGVRFNLSDSGVFRRIKKWGDQEYGASSIRTFE